MHSEILQAFRHLTSLSNQEEELVREVFKPATLKKKEFFIKSGEPNEKLAFIRKGLVRYFVIKNKEESTLEFTKEHEFISEYPTFINQQTSIQYIQAIEDCELLVADYNGVQRIFNETENGNFLGRKVIEHRFSLMISQLLSIHMHTPVDRYKHFIDNYSDLTQRIPQYLIATYVGIRPQSLSRIRNKMSKGVY